MIRVIHVGVGGRGIWPVNLIKDRNDFKSVAFVDINEEALNHACNISGLDKKFCFKDMETALEKVQADAVIIITPPQLHFKQCLTAIEAGKHIFVEKPFTLSFHEAKKIVDTADKKNLKVCVAQNVRYRSINITLSRIIKEKVYGDVCSGILNVLCWRPNVKHSAKVKHSYLWERGVHDLDTLRSIVNCEPIYVSGYSFNPTWSPYEHGAGVNAIITFENGASFSYSGNFSSRFSKNTLIIECEKASLKVEGDRIFIIKNNSSETEILEPEPQKLLPEEILLDRFYKYITENIEPPFGGHENLKTIAFVEGLGIASDNLKVINLKEFYKGTF